MMEVWLNEQTELVGYFYPSVPWGIPAVCHESLFFRWTHPYSLVSLMLPLFLVISFLFRTFPHVSWLRFSLHCYVMRAFYLFLDKKDGKLWWRPKTHFFSLLLSGYLLHAWASQVFFTFWFGFNQITIVWSGRWERQVEVNKTDQSFIGFRKKLVARMVVVPATGPKR